MDGTAAVGISDLLRRAAIAQPAATAVIDSAAAVTWAELDDAVNRAANGYLARLAEPGDRVTLQLPTGLDFVTAYLGALRAGLIAVPINPASTGVEVDFIRNDCAATLHVDGDTVGTLGEAAAEAGDPHRDRGGEELSVLLYTSGTSGHPRAAMLSARALLANLDQLNSVDPPMITGADILFLPLPLSHVFGLNAGLGMALRVGATLVLADRFDATATLATMAEQRVTAVLGVPGQYAQWLRNPDMARGFASVRFAMSGSTTLPRALLEGYRERGIVIYDGYGLTEASPVVSVNALGDRDHPKAGSIGRPLPGIDVQLRDEDGDEVEVEDPGRLFIRGANLFSGYWPDGADGPDPEGWFGTGDIAVADADDDLHLVGRSTELVIVNGFNVYPAEVEAVLGREPGVGEVAVTGIPDEVTGEAVVAYVVPTPGARLDADLLLAAAARSLARFKLPARISVVDALPHTVTGKIMKWQLARDGAPVGGD
ncbi:MAG TPA: AMP-binding protein [Jatrophihabitantaceae bacterium]|nr:AMP-binding protein [Jatrophihabitantaceae bacterium]